jgi:hypothetical protein
MLPFELSEAALYVTAKPSALGVAIFFAALLLLAVLSWAYKRRTDDEWLGTAPGGV